jgi:hypothetical protein
MPFYTSTFIEAAYKQTMMGAPQFEKKKRKTWTRAGLPNFSRGVYNFSEIWPTCGQNEIRHTECKKNKYTYT